MRSSHTIVMHESAIHSVTSRPAGGPEFRDVADEVAHRELLHRMREAAGRLPAAERSTAPATCHQQ